MRQRVRDSMLTFSLANSNCKVENTICACTTTNLNQRRERAENFLSFDVKKLITYEQGSECMRRRQECSYSALLVLKSGKIPLFWGTYCQFRLIFMKADNRVLITKKRK